MMLRALWRPYLFRALLRVIAVPAVVALVAMTGCSASLADATGVNSKTPETLVVAQGNGQSAQAGRDLPTPILFRVLSASGAGVPGVTVSLSVAAGGGAVTPASDTTDARGEFKAKWTLGPGEVDQRIIAVSPGVPTVSVAATGLLPTQIILVQGNNQSAKTGLPVTNSIIVRVVGDANVPMQGVTVGFQVLTGGGGMTPLTVVTNALGEASTKWTLGAVGQNTALVVSGKLTPVTLTATATP
jgi:hypothetical protein